MKILLVEDERKVARALVRGLMEEGHQIDVCDHAEAADAQLAGLTYDLVILDWMLPDQDGLSLLRSWRARGERVPVLMLTARGEVGERVLGLRAGADDYLPKPFDFEELLARIEAVTRRGSTVDAELGGVTLDGKRRELVHDGQRVELTAREFSLSVRFFAHPGEVLTRTELLETVWGSSTAVEPNAVDVYVGYIRRKLESIGVTSLTVRTVRGIGFKLEEVAS